MLLVSYNEHDTSLSLPQPAAAKSQQNTSNDMNQHESNSQSAPKVAPVAQLCQRGR